MPNSGNIQAFFFRFRRDSHAFDFVHDPEDYECQSERPDCVQGRAHKLNPELPRIAVDQTGDTLASVSQVTGRSNSVPTRAVYSVGEDAHTNCPQPATQTVDGDCAAWVVDSKNALVEENPAAHQSARKNPDDY
jgi:hypothetical protein